MKIFISAPMPNEGYTEEEINKHLEQVVAKIKADPAFDDGKEPYIVSGYAPGGYPDWRGKIQNMDLYRLACSIALMSECDVAYFCRGWNDSRACQLEFEIAVRHGIEIMYELY